MPQAIIFKMCPLFLGSLIDRQNRYKLFFKEKQMKMRKVCLMRRGFNV